FFPEPNFEYFIYQTLVGFYSDDPNQKNRMIEYVLKAAKEAKVYTNWIARDLSYENALETFIERLFASSEFMSVFLPFQKKIAKLGELNSFSAFVLRLGSPGVFDLYQGLELFDYSLVDPDNRRKVDFAKRIALLNEQKELPKDGDPLKLFLHSKGLCFRRDNPQLFIQGDYTPLKVEGKYKDHVVAFMRTYENKQAIFIGTRFLGENPSFEDTWIELKEKRRWTNLFTGKEYLLDSSLICDLINPINIAVLI
ncbi:MAG: hypothetical protein KAR79_00240, partial [Simkaniaceae bacterium]|nr:hypothetical protein [Simkaniaceae bacterium]